LHRIGEPTAVKQLPSEILVVCADGLPNAALPEKSASRSSRRLQTLVRSAQFMHFAVV
jgi:hypothetical protein